MFALQSSVPFNVPKNRRIGLPKAGYKRINFTIFLFLSEE